MSKRKVQLNRLHRQFSPARLSIGKEWYISYYVAHPSTGNLVRIRTKWNKITDPKLRRLEGKREVKRINSLLRSGWNPLLKEAEDRFFAPLGTAVAHYFREKERLASEGNVRSESMRTYRSYAKIFQEWCGEARWNGPCDWLTEAVVDQFLEYIHLKRGRTARTRNNYLTFFRGLGKWMRRKRYLRISPADEIEKLREAPKRRQVIDDVWLERIFDYMRETHHPYYVLCRTIYYCFIRRRELVYLQVKHINLDARTILVPSEFSKNGKDDVVTIPAPLYQDLKAHLSRAKHPEHYVFSNSGFQSGAHMETVKKVSDTWAKFRKMMKFPREYQFYSLKDTGITKMLMRGIPVLIVRDQARHHDISITDRYTPRGMMKAAPELLDYQ